MSLDAGARPGLRIAFIGDMMIGRKVEAALALRSPESFWGDLLPVLRSADLVVANLECPITTSSRRWPHPKAWKFRASPAALPILQAAGVGAVNLANNHMGDYCEEGLVDTLTALDAAGIRWYGAGRTLAEAMRPASLTLAGRRIGLVGFSDRMVEYGAAADRPGTQHVNLAEGEIGARRILSATAGQDFDLTIASAHWGPDLMRRPTRRRRRFAEALVAAGADVIHGTSSHVLHGVGLAGGRPILYDCGNALDDYWRYPWPWTRRSFVFLLEIGETESRLVLHPYDLRGQTLCPPQPAIRRALCNGFRKRSAELGTPVLDHGDRLEIQLGPALSRKLAGRARLES